MGRGSNIKLWEFDTALLAQGATDAKHFYRAMQKDGEAIAYYCNADGSGAFAPMAAAAAARFIQEVVQRARVVPGVSSLPKYSEKYKKIKNSGRGFHFRTGRFSEHISYTVQKFGSRSLAFVSMAEGTSKSGVAMNTLAKWLEHGTSRAPARPVMHLAMHAFIAQKLPPMLHAVKKAIMKSIAKNHQYKGYGVIGKGELATLNVASHFSHVDPFKISSAIDQSEAKQILQTIGMGSSNLSKWV